MSEVMPALRQRRLRALGVEPLRLRRPLSVENLASMPAAVAEPGPRAVPAVPAAAPEKTSIRRLALHPDPAELDDPLIRNMYAALTEAVGKAGLQRVRVCDVAEDPSAAVMVFGAAPLPEGVPMLRVLRADPLTVLHMDRERKRLLWEQMRALGRGNG
ncbi:MAG TPA: hypothetical protein VHA71_00670 [Rhodanobacteraceae bacterium]|jgi:hypothetical protein|nr:hypothetical protein [Rhodanobacteraceae bacterium]